MSQFRTVFIIFAILALASADCGGTQKSCGNPPTCYEPSTHSCQQDQGGAYVVCQIGYQACQGQCYSTDQYTCSNNRLSPKPSTTAKSSTTSSVKASSSSTSRAATTSSTTKAATTSSTTKAATTASPTTSASPVNANPVAAPTSSQTADLRIVNNCKMTLWFEGRYGGDGAPIPGQSTTATQALPGAYVDYTVPSTGLAGSRFWAKYGCDSNGKNCLIGDQMQYYPNPPGGCPAGGCTPPVDSLFEATWGCKPGASCNSNNPTTWFDTSQVDGWTIPYKLTPVGDTSKCDCSGSNCGFTGVDASTLDLAKCPSGEDLTNNNTQMTATSNGQTTSLKSVDLRIINNNQVLGCMSPCKRLNWGAPYGLGQSESSGSTMWMCCPTPSPDNCQPSNGCVSPQQCRAGPIVQTQYVAAVHRMAAGVYSYSYDDGVGLHACPAGVVKYTMTFCPAGSSSYPLQL